MRLINKMKNAQGLTLNIMVIAALVIVVLIISIVLFSSFVNNSVGPSVGELTGCSTGVQSGKCEELNNCGGTKVNVGKRNCPNGLICCVDKEAK